MEEQFEEGQYSSNEERDTKSTASRRGDCHEQCSSFFLLESSPGPDLLFHLVQASAAGGHTPRHRRRHDTRNGHEPKGKGKVGSLSIDSSDSYSHLPIHWELL